MLRSKMCKVKSWNLKRSFTESMGIKNLAKNHFAGGNFEDHLFPEVSHVLLREADWRISADELSNHAAKDPTVAVIHLSRTVANVHFDPSTHVERNSLLVLRFVTQVLFHRIENSLIWGAH